MKPALLIGAWIVLASCVAPPSARAPQAAGRLVIARTPPGAGERFLGSVACRRCHQEAWIFWRTTAHARGLRTLGAADRADPVCLRCHATGYGDPLGFREEALTPELADVGCEVCHGAGASHADSRHPELVPTLTGGDCPPCEINKICRFCHTLERSPTFDLGRDLKKVDCRAAAAGRQ